MEYKKTSLLILIVTFVCFSSSLKACELLLSDLQEIDSDCLLAHYQQSPEYWIPPYIDAGIEWQKLTALPPPQPQTLAEKARIALGKNLFFDELLSRNKDISCASCHMPELGFADGTRVSTGHNQRQGRRNAPSVVMSSFTQSPFWDGRTHSLEEQALKPIEDPVEMAFTIKELVKRLNASKNYQKRFKDVFDSEISADKIASALASYQRSLLPYDTAFNHFMQGQYDALDEQQIRGLHLFRTKARCMNCHHGVALSDDKFHNLGLTYYGRKYEDLGRYEVTEREEDIGRFRTPSLRLVSKTGPWMHNGLFPYLGGVINMYDAGMPQPKARVEQQNDFLFPKTSSIIKPLKLTPSEKQDLEAFLRSL